MKKYIILFFVFSVLPFFFMKFVNIKAATHTGVTDTNRNVIDTAGIIFLLDWKRVSSQWAIANLQNGKIVLHGTHEARKAIIYYGEKYRTGVYFCEIIKGPDK